MKESPETQDHYPKSQVIFNELSLGAVICINILTKKGRSLLSGIYIDLQISLKFCGSKVDCEILCLYL